MTSLEFPVPDELRELRERTRAIPSFIVLSFPLKLRLPNVAQLGRENSATAITRAS